MEKGRHILCLLLVLGYLLPITNQASSACRYISDLSQDQVWSFYAYSKFELYFTLVVGAVSVVALLFAAATWIYSPSIVTPSDIMLIIVLGTLVDNLSLYAQAVYYRIHEENSQPGGFPGVCSGLGFFNMVGNIVALYYNTFFCVSLAYSINNTLRKPFLDNLKMHLLCLLATVSAILIIIFTQNPGAPLSGLCIYRLANQSSLGVFFLHLLLLTICIYSMKKFRAKIPKNSYFQKRSHFRYYNSYLFFFALCQLANTLLYLVGNISCQTQSNSLSDLLSNLYATANIIAILQGLGIALLRLSHPRFMARLKKNWKKDVVDGDLEIQEEEQEWMDSLVESIKGSEILSFIQAIMMNYIEHSSRYPSELTPYHFQREYSFLIDEVIAEDYVRRRVTNRDSHFNRQNSAGLKTLRFEVTIYTPQFYSWLFRRDGLNLFRSFDIRRNLSLVKQESYTEGGKSGEFFFATFDHQFIFKTIKAEQSEICSQKAQDFHAYYMKHENSLLIKILGLYRFRRRDIEDIPIHLILMRNLTLATKSQNIRVYDIKGSQFNRSTLSERRISPTDEQKLRKYTLKDKDFLAIEGKVAIDPEKADMLKQILVRDIHFLAGLGVMDYSLLIIKRQGEPSGQLGEYESINQPGVFFNVGIIDYLEEWTLRRKAQRIFKTLITSEEVTASSPLTYADRLIEFMHQII